MKDGLKAHSIFKQYFWKMTLTTLLFYGITAGAQACQTSYTVQAGESLASIADTVYSDESKWTLIYYANQARFGFGGEGLRVGEVLRLPCFEQSPPTTTTSTVSRETPTTDRPDGSGSSVMTVFATFRLTSETEIGDIIGVAAVEDVEIEIAGRLENALAIRLNLENLTPGPRAFHVHTNADCGPAEQNGKMVRGLGAGPHLYAHSVGAVAGVKYSSHLGDLPDLVVGSDGKSTDQIIAPRLRLSDVRGRTMIIHAGADDTSYRQACAIIP